MVAVLMLRRLAYNLLALFRAVTQRSEDLRQTPWNTVMPWVYNMLIAAQTSGLEGLRNPQVATIEVRGSAALRFDPGDSYPIPARPGGRGHRWREPAAWPQRAWATR